MQPHSVALLAQARTLLSRGELGASLTALLPSASRETSPTAQAAAATFAPAAPNAARNSRSDVTRTFATTIAVRRAVLGYEIDAESTGSERRLERRINARAAGETTSTLVASPRAKASTRAQAAGAALVSGVLSAIREASSEQQAALLPALATAIRPIVAGLPVGALREGGVLTPTMGDAAALFVDVALRQPRLSRALLETAVALTFATGSLRLLLSIAAAAPRIVDTARTTDVAADAADACTVHPALASSLLVALRGVRYAARLRSRRLDWRALHSDALTASAAACRAAAAAPRCRFVHCRFAFALTAADDVISEEQGSGSSATGAHAHTLGRNRAIAQRSILGGTFVRDGDCGWPLRTPRFRRVAPSGVRCDAAALDGAAADSNMNAAGADEGAVYLHRSPESGRWVIEVVAAPHAAVPALESWLTTALGAGDGVLHAHDAGGADVPDVANAADDSACASAEVSFCFCLFTADISCESFSQFDSLPLTFFGLCY